MPNAAEQMQPGCRGTRPIEVTIEPAWDVWKSALSRFEPSASREQIGIPNDAPLVMSGHQPVVFHNGILAKLIAQHEAAKRTGAHRVWIVADQDHVDLETIRVPLGRGKHLKSHTIQLLEPASTPPGVPSASLPAMSINDTDDTRLAPLVSHLRDCAHESSLARQFASATIRLACDRLGIGMPLLIYASELLSSDQMFAFTQCLIDEPQPCVRAYNNAAADHPQARVRPLTIEDDRIELPLWGLRANRARVPIDTLNIHEFHRETLVPRGLLMSMLARCRLCELFIHGTGGWNYDKITEQWAKTRLDIKLDMRMAPMALTTATQHLQLGFERAEAIGLDEARWVLHHARHTPSMVGDEQTQREKDELVEQIAAMKKINENPDPVYQRMVHLLQAYREKHRKDLETLQQRVEHARRNRTQIELANDRTWPFVLFGDEQLGELKRAVVDAMR